jgi:hypothetical protein
VPAAEAVAGIGLFEPSKLPGWSGRERRRGARAATAGATGSEAVSVERRRRRLGRADPGARPGHRIGAGWADSGRRRSDSSTTIAPMRLVFSPEAEQDIERIDSWWREKWAESATPVCSRAGEGVRGHPAKTADPEALHRAARGSDPSLAVEEDRAARLLRGRHRTGRNHRPARLGCSPRARPEAVTFSSFAAAQERG